MNTIIISAFNINLKIMRYFLLFPKSVFQQVILGTMHFILSAIVPSFYFLTMFHLEDFSVLQMISTGCLVMQLFTLNFKLIPFVFTRDLIKDLLDCLVSRQFTNYLPEQERFIQEANYITRRNFKVYSLPIASSLTCVVLNAIIDGTMPFDIWLPYDVNNSIVYWTTFVFMAAAIYRAGFLNASIDILVQGALCHASAQLQILKDSIENMSLNVESNGRNDTTYVQIISFCNHYDTIYDFVKIIENSLSMVLFTQLLGSITVVGLCCVRIILIKDSPFDVFTSLSYLLAMISQIFLFCYYGNLLYDQSLSVSSSIFMTEWYNYDAKSKKALILFMERLKKPMMVTAGKTLELSLETLIMIMRRAYSFLAVVNSRSEVLLN